MIDVVISALSAALAIFIILDPLLSVVMFVNLTQGLSRKDIFRQAFIAVGVAGALMMVFLFFNNFLFDVLNVELESFKIAGGIILLLMGLQIVLGVEIGGSSAGHKSLADPARKGKKAMAGVIIGTPIMCGPGSITTVMVLGAERGTFVTLAAIVIAIFCIWLILIFSRFIKKLLGETVVVLLSKILGLLSTTIAVHMIWTGIRGLIQMSMV